MHFACCGGRNKLSLFCGVSDTLFRQPQSAESTPGSFDDDVVSFLDLPVNHREDSITDEVFVSKFVLAEQVFRQVSEFQ